MSVGMKEEEEEEVGVTDDEGDVFHQVTWNMVNANQSSIKRTP